MFYLKKQNMLCFAPHQEDSKETEQEKVSCMKLFPNPVMFCRFVLQEALKRCGCGEWKANYQRERENRSKDWLQVIIVIEVPVPVQLLLGLR